MAAQPSIEQPVDRILYPPRADQIGCSEMYAVPTGLIALLGAFMGAVSTSFFGGSPWENRALSSSPEALSALGQRPAASAGRPAPDAVTRWPVSGGTGDSESRPG